MRSPSHFPLFVLVPVLTGCIVIDGGGSTHSVEASEDFAIPAAGVERLRAVTGNGSVELRGRPDAAEIRVSVLKEALGRSRQEAEDNLQRMRVTHEVVAGELVLGWEWARPRLGNRSASVTFRIEAPAGLPADFTAVNGLLSVRGWAADLKGTATNGSIDVQGVFGRVELITQNGDIDVRLDGAGPLDGSIQTTNGDVDVRVGTGLSTMVVASTRNGRVRHSGRLGRAESGSNFLVGDFGDGEGRLRVASVNGGVRIR